MGSSVFTSRKLWISARRCFPDVSPPASVTMAVPGYLDGGAASGRSSSPNCARTRSDEREWPPWSREATQMKEIKAMHESKATRHGKRWRLLKVVPRHFHRAISNDETDTTLRLLVDAYFHPYRRYVKKRCLKHAPSICFAKRGCSFAWSRKGATGRESRCQTDTVSN